MIVTLTMNPALDRTLYVDALQKGTLNRIRECQLDAGGKGINVSRMLKVMGDESIVCGVLAGDQGKKIQSAVEAAGLKSDFTWVEGESRVNTKVIEDDGTMTELNEPGPKVKTTVLNAIAETLEKYASPETLFVLSGSVPPGVPTGYYRYLTVALHSKGGKVLMDADGALLTEGIGGYPDILKPNLRELIGCYAASGNDVSSAPSQKQLLSYCQSVMNKDGGHAAISLGSDGSFFLDQDRLLFTEALKVPVKSTVGAGDAMVAALAHSFEHKMTFEYTARLATAAAAASCMTSGTRPPAMDQISLLMGQVKLKDLS